jgi:methylenetetrahydrofolate reductase (NADPH)
MNTEPFFDEPSASNLDEDSKRHQLKRSIVEFVRNASTEISPRDEELLPTLAKELPPGIAVYVAHTPRSSLEDVVRVSSKVQALGFRASPHIVARRLPSERALKDGLSALAAAGVEQALLVAGDLDHPLGKFKSTLEVIDTGLLDSSGIKRIGVAGHPEGHRSIEPAMMFEALRRKQDFAARTGIEVHIVTQFGFNPKAIYAWVEHLLEEGISLPVHAGIAGPTPLPKLIKFAMQCGVGASMHSLMKNMSAMANLARVATTSDEMLIGSIQARAAGADHCLTQPHFYAFGGTVETATWLRAVAEGRFEVQPDLLKFQVNTREGSGLSRSRSRMI